MERLYSIKYMIEENALMITSCKITVVKSMLGTGLECL